MTMWDVCDCHVLGTLVAVRGLFVRCLLIDVTAVHAKWGHMAFFAPAPPRLALRKIGSCGEEFVLDASVTEGLWVGRWRERVALWCDDGGRPSRASRLHARLAVDEAGAWCLHDNKSANGTFLNGERVDRAPLKPGDRVGFGTSTEGAGASEGDATLPHFHFTVVATKSERSACQNEGGQGCESCPESITDLPPATPLSPLPPTPLEPPAQQPTPVPVLAMQPPANPAGLRLGVGRMPRAASVISAAVGAVCGPEEAPTDAEAAAEQAACVAEAAGAHDERKALLSLLSHVRRHASRVRSERDTALVEGKAMLEAIIDELRAVEQLHQLAAAPAAPAGDDRTLSISASASPAPVPVLPLLSPNLEKEVLPEIRLVAQTSRRSASSAAWPAFGEEQQREEQQPERQRRPKESGEMEELARAREAQAAAKQRVSVLEAEASRLREALAGAVQQAEKAKSEAAAAASEAAAGAVEAALAEAAKARAAAAAKLRDAQADASAELALAHAEMRDLRAALDSVLGEVRLADERATTAEASRSQALMLAAEATAAREAAVSEAEAATTLMVEACERADAAEAMALSASALQDSQETAQKAGDGGALGTAERCVSAGATRLPTRLLEMQAARLAAAATALGRAAAAACQEHGDELGSATSEETKLAAFMSGSRNSLVRAASGVDPSLPSTRAQLAESDDAEGESPESPRRELGGESRSPSPTARDSARKPGREPAGMGWGRWMGWGLRK